MIDDNCGKINLMFDQRGQRHFMSIALVALMGRDKQDHESHFARSLEENGVTVS